jgi:hypothetical protein
MANADWSIAVGIFTFIIALVFAVIYFIRYRKISLILFVASIATYIFAVFYTWDVFEPNQNTILAMLAVSAVIMLLLAKYFSKFKIKPSKAHTSLKEKDN